MKHKKRKPVNHQQILVNRAELANAAPRENICEKCSEGLIFAMRDGEHDFSIGLITVLRCLRIAEELGDVPKLPDAWWLYVEKRYGWDALKERGR